MTEREETATSDIVEQLRQSLGFMDDGCDGCVPEECGDKMVATIANEAADEIAALRAIVRYVVDSHDIVGNLEGDHLDTLAGWRLLSEPESEVLARALSSGRRDEP